jgi:O-antigen ligase
MTMVQPPNMPPSAGQGPPLLLAQAAGPGEVGTRQPGTMSAKTYFLVLLLVGIPFGMIVQTMLALGQPGVAIALGIVILMVLVLWRVEVGLFLVAALLFWQYQTRPLPYFTLVKITGMVVTVFAVPWILRVRGPSWPKMVKLVFAFLVWVTVSTLINLEPPLLNSVLDLAAVANNIIFLYLLMRFCHTPAAFKALVIIVVLSSAGEAVLGLVRPATVVRGSVEAAERLTTHAELGINQYVRLMMPGIFLAPLLMSYTRNRLWQIGLVAIVILCGTASILTVSRGAMIGIGMGVVVMLLTMKGLSAGHKILVLLAAVILVAGVLVVSQQFGAGEPWAERMAASSLGDATTTRLRRWTLALEGALDAPLFGIGIGREHEALWRRGIGFTESHNDLITVLHTTGFPGLLLFLGFLFFTFKGLWSIRHRMARASLLGLWTALVVAGFFNPQLTKKIFWMPAGLSAAAIVLYGPASRFFESRRKSVRPPEGAAPLPAGPTPHP